MLDGHNASVPMRIVCPYHKSSFAIILVHTENYIVEERPFPGVLVLVLNRPRKKNAISGAMYLHVSGAVES
jgi:hypothetical protein